MAKDLKYCFQLLIQSLSSVSPFAIVPAPISVNSRNSSSSSFTCASSGSCFASASRKKVTKAIPSSSGSSGKISIYIFSLSSGDKGTLSSICTPSIPRSASILLTKSSAWVVVFMVYLFHFTKITQSFPYTQPQTAIHAYQRSSASRALNISACCEFICPS